jgi:DNA sulfur modification protein DndB
MASTIVPALRIRQGKHVLYVMSVDAKKISDITIVPRLEQVDGDIRGYQREEVTAHIRQIREYLDGKDPLLPNSLIVAFDGKSPRFKAVEGQEDFGFLSLSKPGRLVDGQQRAAAFRDSAIEEGSFPVPIVAFVAEDEAEQADHFIRVNNVKPLSKSLINTLLPCVDTPISTEMERRQFASVILKRLANDQDSPLAGLIRTPLNKEGWVNDGTIIDMIHESMRNDLFVAARETGDIEAIVKTLKQFWGAASVVFKDAWIRPGKESRLFMRSGILSLSMAMTVMVDDADGKVSRAFFERGLRYIAPHCRWTPTNEVWNLGGDGKFNWDAIENTMKSATKLGDAMGRWYRRALKDSNAQVEVHAA